MEGALGRIPFRLRIGAAGHRKIEDPDLVVARIQEALAIIRARVPASPATSVRFTVVSALAEGADRLIAGQVLIHEGAMLEAILPVPRQDYERDFSSDRSREEFRSMLGGAVVAEGPATDDREAGYEWAGQRVVERCDVLLVLWDGAPARGRAGTAHVVAYARQRRVPVVWIPAAGAHAIVQEWAGFDPVVRAAFRPLDSFNGEPLGDETFEHRRKNEESSLLSQGPLIGGAPLQPLVDWILPFFIRADELADRYQRRYEILGDVLFLTAAGAVLTAAAQAMFAPGIPELVWIEVGMMVGLLLLVIVGRRRRLHERWISCRFLAERFRSAFFLALSGLSIRREGGLEQGALGHSSEEWVRRSFSEVWRDRPSDLPAPAVQDLRAFLTHSWIEDQIAYHRKTARKHARWHHRLGRATEALFAITIVAAILHAVGVGEHASEGAVHWTELFVFLSIAMPAVGGALGGIRAQREHLRHAERYGRMTDYLQAVGTRMERAADLEAVQSLAAEAEGIMLEENRDWFMVMRFHDFELHV